MRLPGRAGRPPAEVRRRVAERVLAWARSDRGWLAGTPAALHVVPTDGDVVRLPWESIQHADWRADDEVLDVVEVGEFGRERTTYALRLPTTPAAQRLVQLVRERVTASVVLQRRVTVAGRRGFTVLGRRSPAGGPVGWFVDYDAGVEPAEVAEEVDAAVARARAEVGEFPI